MSTNTPLYHSEDLSRALGNLVENCRKRIAELPAADLSQDGILDSLKRDFVVIPLQLRRDKMYMEPAVEVKGPVADTDRFYPPGAKANGYRIVLVLPFDGDEWLFSMRPPPVSVIRFAEVPLDATVTDGAVRMTYEFAQHRRDKLQQTYESELNKLEACIRQQGPAIEKYNESIISVMEAAVSLRRDALSDLDDFTASLGLRTKPAPPPKESTIRETVMKKPIVFLCHCSEDAAKAVSLYDQLVALGVDAWLDKKNLVSGDVWESEIKKAVASSDAFVVCLSMSFDKTGFRQQEVHWAREALQRRSPGRGFIIPHLFEPCPIPDWCKSIHAGPDTSRPSEFDDLVRAIEKHCDWTRPSNSSESSGAAHQPTPAANSGVSRDGIELLKAAVEADGYILVGRHMGGDFVQGGRREFIEDNNPRSAARWNAVVRELENARYIQNTGMDGFVFLVTDTGYDLFLAKAPRARLGR